MKRYILSIILLLYVSFAGGIEAVAQQISSYIYGQNHWMAGGDEKGRPGYLDRLWPMVEESGIGLVRIGGNGYLRLPEIKVLDAMVDSVRSIGAEPLLQIPGYYTEEQTKELVCHFNKESMAPVKFWCIGNEPLHKFHNMTIEEVYEYIMRIAPAIREVDPSVRIFVFDEASMIDDAYGALCGGRLDVCGKTRSGHWIIDGFAFHCYPNGPEFSRDDVVYSGPKKIERQICSLKRMMEEADLKHGRKGEDSLVWGLTEVNVTYANPDREISGYGNPSFLGGQFIAEMYGLGMKYGAFTVAPWCICETDRVRTDFGYIGLPEEFHPRSAYYHTKMLADHFRGRYVPSFTNQGYVKTIASEDGEQIAVMILNQDNLRAYEFSLDSSESFSRNPLDIRLDTNMDLKYNGRIEAATTMVLIFDKLGRLVKQVTYGLGDNLKSAGPRYLWF